MEPQAELACQRDEGVMEGLCSAASSRATTGWLRPSSLASAVWLTRVRRGSG
jgi:hypothetical protein